MGKFISIPGVKPIRVRRLTKHQKVCTMNEKIRDWFGKDAADEHRACGFDGAQEKVENERNARRKEFLSKVRKT
jgi:hypothetical protein